MVESRGYTLLAFAAFKSHEHCFMVLYKHAVKYNLDSRDPETASRILKEWADQPTDEKFTALHFSAYHGTVKLIRVLLDEMNADLHFINCYGANVLHIAAQGDQPAPLFYFINERRMNIDFVDNRGSTPLHWACYSGAEYALQYILALGPNINC